MSFGNEREFIDHLQYKNGSLIRKASMEWNEVKRVIQETTIQDDSIIAIRMNRVLIIGVGLAFTMLADGAHLKAKELLDCQKSQHQKLEEE